MFKIDTNFQTPTVVANHMATMAETVELTHRCMPIILEPTPGVGNLVSALERSFGAEVVRFPTGDFWESSYSKIKGYDIIVMNPPFSPYTEMTRFVNRALELSDNVIALLPVNYITSERRAKGYAAKGFGLISVTMLPRRTFPNMVATCILEFKKGYEGKTEFKRFTW